MRVILILAVCLAAVAAVPRNPQKIVGGSVTTISQYPSMASLLHSWDLSTYWQTCGGTILNTRTILTAAHCTYHDPVYTWRVRVGSTYANSGGVVHSLASTIHHPNYDDWSLVFDFALLRTASAIRYVNNAVQPGMIAGANYYLADNQVVWATGWGSISPGGQGSEQLRHVQMWTINLDVCRQRYADFGSTISDHMLCSGWLDVGGRDQCQGDSGGPLYHNGVVVGVCSWGESCATARYPGINARVTSASTWIQANA